MKEKPRQLDFFGPEEEEKALEPTKEEERWLLGEMYGPEARGAPLSGGERRAKTKKKKEKNQQDLERLKKKLGLPRRGQEELDI